MLRLDGVNLDPSIRSVVVNGAHVDATLADGTRLEVRKPNLEHWYDERHRKVVGLLHALGGALSELVMDEAQRLL